MNTRILIISILVLLLSPLFASAATIRVPADQPTIQAGIDAANDGDTVLLANGGYTGEGNRVIRFRGKAITLRSENGPDSCVIDAQSEPFDRHNVFVIHVGETRDTVISGVTIRGGDPAGILISNSYPTIRNCVIQSNRGDGIRLQKMSYDNGALIESCRIINNWDTGIYSDTGGSTLITDCAICNNYGTGVYTWRGSLKFLNCLIAGNVSSNHGGGFRCDYSSPDIINCTIVDNSAENDGGGIYSSFYSDPEVENCIIAGNSAATGDQISLDWTGDYARLTISHSDVFGEINVDSGCHLEEGPGLIDEDPLFTSGPDGEHYLSQVNAGQPATSPCVDSGNPESELIDGTTRTDSVVDYGVVDMGYHYEPAVENGLPDTRILSGPETGDWISSSVVVFTFSGEDALFPASEMTYSWRFDDDPWSTWSPHAWAAIDGLEGTMEHIAFEVRARNPEGEIDPTPAARWFNFDSSFFFVGERLVVGPGPAPGNPPLVRTWYGEWAAYNVYRYGVNVATGDIDGDGTDEVITGPGPGAEFGPHVRCFQPDGTIVHNAGFMAYGTLKYGVNVACGDLDGDGTDEIVTGAGPGAVFGPHVRGWNHDGGPGTHPIPGVSFLAYGTNKYGVNVACGDLDGDNRLEIITGAGPGAVFGAHVRGWRFDGVEVSAMSDVNYFAFGTPKWGVNVACGDFDGDGLDEIATGAGPGPTFGAHVRAWDYDGSEIAQMPGISFFAYPDTLYGVVVAAANIDAEPNEELITVPGPGPLNTALIQVWDVEGGEPQHNSSFPSSGWNNLDDWLTYGGRVAGSKNGW